MTANPLEGVRGETRITHKVEFAEKGDCLGERNVIFELLHRVNAERAHGDLGRKGQVSQQVGHAQV